MIIRARIVVTMDGPPIEDGAVLVRDTTVGGVGRWIDLRREYPTEPVEDLGEVVLLPGFINAHCHLDYSGLRHAILPPKSFAEWVGRINALKHSLDEDDYLAAIAKGFREYGRWGATTLLNIESFPELMWKIPAPPLRTWWFYEMIDVRQAVPTEQLVAGALLFFQEQLAEGSPGWLGGRGLSPHAPYTASREMYRLTRDVSARTGMPWTTHLGESRDEQDMFVHGRGPLYEFLRGIGRPMDDCGKGASSLASLTAAGCIGPECIAVHLNEWEETDFALVAPGGTLAGMTIVHCPLSHRYFKHREFPLDRLRTLGVNFCVGTDSPVSDGSFSLLDELRALAATAPEMSPLELLESITTAPARALQLEGKIGCIRSGAFADLIALPCATAGGGTIHAEIVACCEPTVWRIINGRTAA